MSCANTKVRDTRRLLIHDRCTGIGVVAGFGAVVLIVEESHVNKGDAT